MIGSDKTKCRKCSSEVKNGDSICCSICNVWHHLHCSDLSREEFLQHTKNKNGNAPNVLFAGVAKCSRVLGKCGCILCNCCNKWSHKRCSLLENDKFDKLVQCEEPWFCLECMTNNLPFYALDEKKVKKLFNIPTKK